MQALNVTMFGNIPVSLDVRIVNVFVHEIECVCIPISTLTHTSIA